MKSGQKFLGAFVLVCACLGVGIQITRHAHGFAQQSTWSNRSGIARDPAAIHKNYDFSQLAGDELDLASKQRLVAAAAVREEPEGVGVALGDFVVLGPDGQKTFACQQYSQIIMRFEGDGSAVDGHKPEMEVEGACEVAGDINMIAPLWIPVAKILGEPVADGEFDFREGHPIRIRFANVIHSWPLAWRLTGVKLVAINNPNQAVEINDHEVHQFAATPLILNFK